MENKIKELKQISGNGTQLISVYIPAKQPIHITTNKLRMELASASNIKSKQTRNGVESALQRLIQLLKCYTNVAPDNGLALFASSDNSFAIEPIEPLNIQMYRCGSKFELSPLEKMLEPKKTYGLIVIDGRDATLALLKGYNIQYVDSIHSMAHSKADKGGQSKRRFERIREESIEFYYKRIGASADSYFMKTAGIIIGGPGPAKDGLVKLKPFNYQLKILGVADTGYTDEQGIRELIGGSQDILNGQELVEERKIVERLLREMRNEGNVVYGLSAVKEAKDRIKELLISKDMRIDLGLSCPIVKISDKTDEGLQFHYMTGGIAAFVKY